MKITRHKKVHRYMSFFCNNYSFRQPYQVLIDGTFCYAALKNKFNIREQMSKYLEGDVKLLTTQCVIIETEQLGHAVFGALVIIKQFALHRCGHETPVPGSQCLESMIGTTNSHRYIVATQDRELQEVVRSVPGTPLIYLHQKAPTLEHPSEASVQQAKLSVESRFGLSKLEQKTLSNLRGKIGIEEEVEIQRKKKKRKKGPNPLSCKKKKTKPENYRETKEGKLGKKRTRKRIKIPKCLKEEVKAELQQLSQNKICS